MNYYLYAETAFHHEGDEVYLCELISAIAETGVQGIKFQVLIDVNEFVSMRHSGYASVSNWVFAYEQWQVFFQLALDKGLDIIMMPLDARAFLLAEEFPVAHLDLHSVSFHDSIVLNKMKGSSLPIILGTGGRTLEEIDAKIDYFSGSTSVLMTGFQAFPSNLVDVRLARVAYLKEYYPNLAIGYADHTSFADDYVIRSLEYAFLLGARVFEKHVTLCEGKKRVDYEAAVGPEKLLKIKNYLDHLDFLTLPAGVSSMEMTQAEVRYRQREKFVVARHDLKKGHVVDSSDLSLKITDEGVGFSSIDTVAGRELKRCLHQDEIVTEDDVL